jgi:threonine dehydrogenase-like Zn-dependent dehydrogenase
VLALRGHKVTVFDTRQDRLALLDGATATASSLDGLDQFDWLIEATGQQAVLSTLLQNCSTGATLLLLGLPYSHHSFSFESIVAYDRSVLGSVGSSGADFETALATLAHIDTAPFLGTSYPLREFEKAWDVVRSRRVLKVMLTADATAG